MSIELDNSEDYKNLSPKNKYEKKEHKWKELLYNLFYEIKSEILNSKIEIEEDEYQENINSTTIPQIVTYIHDSIQILLKKKIEDTKEEQKELDKKFYLESNIITNINVSEDVIGKYENIIKNLESKQRHLTKINFQQKLQIDAMENKIEEYMEMEDEFEEMKTKLKYEDGRFLNNDRKDNEIIIIRGENSILKNEINKLEEHIKNIEKEKSEKENMINELNKQMEVLKNKIDEKQSEANSPPSININISNVNSNDHIHHNNNETDGGGSGIANSNMKKNNYNRNNNNNFNSNSKFFYNYVNEQISINNKKNTFSSKKKKEKNEKNNHKNYYRNKTSKDKKLLSQKIKTKLLNNKNNICDLLSTTRNESLDRAKQDLLNKYLIGIKGNKNIINLNNSCIKVNNLTGKIYCKKNGNINIQSTKKSYGFNSNRSNSNKTKIPSTSISHNNVISYRSVS